MAVYGYLRNELEDVALFVSTDASYSSDKNGIFNFVPNSSEYEYFYNNYKIFVAAAGIDPSNVVDRLNISGGSYTKEEENYAVLTSGTVHVSPNRTRAAIRGDLTIIDEHGTHKGTANCQNQLCAYSSSYPGCIGVQHESSDTGWTFKGWRVTSSSSSAFTIPSEGYEYKYDFASSQYVWQLESYPTEEEINGALIIYDISGYYPIVVEAIYEESPKWTLSFNLNGGTGDAPSVETYQGDSITIPNYFPVKDGYTFLGWALSPDATTAEYVAGDSLTPNQNIVLYAVWEVTYIPPTPQFTISFDLNGGTGSAPPITIDQGSSIIIPNYSPTRDGYTFLGWAQSSGATTAEYVAGDEFTPGENATLYAVWELIYVPPEGGGSNPTKGFIRRSSKSDYLIFSITSGNLVYN